jgi:hypothetical protein
MKKLLLILLCLPMIGFGQEIITNKNGEKILLKLDGTWEYLHSKENKKELIKGLRFLMKECIDKYDDSKKDMLLVLSNPEKILRKDKVIVKKFNVRDYEILDIPYSHWFLLRDNNGLTGYYFNRCNNIKVGVGEDTLYSSYNEVKRYFNDRNHNRRLSHNPKHPIEIKSVLVPEINSAGGVKVSIEWEYLDKENDIKYIEFTVVPYNAVGDIVSGGYSGTRRTLSNTGPIEADSYTNEWETVFYNSTIYCVKIVKVAVTYMDGRNYTYVKELDKISSPYLKYYSF